MTSPAQAVAAPEVGNEACDDEGPVAEMDRIRRVMAPERAVDDREDLISYAKEVVRLREENHGFRTWGIIEVAVRNPSVAEYMDHWEARAEASESTVAQLTRELEQAREALAEIVDPISAMRTRLPTDGQLNGTMAVILATDTGYLQSIARKALENTND